MRSWVLFCALALVRACNSTDSIYDDSYTECILSTTCMDAFYLTPVHHTWERHRFDLLLDIVLGAVAPLDNVTICASTESFEVWMTLISHWNFCQKNEVYSELTGDCVCRRDKNCDPTMNGTLGYASAMEWVLVILLTIAFLYYVPSYLKKLSLLEQHLKPHTTLAQHLHK